MSDETDEPMSRQARLHEEAVKKVAKSPPKYGKRRRGRRDTPASSAVVSTKVRPEVWAAARALTAHPRNIQIISETEVIVWNHEPPWPVKRP